MLSLTGKRWLLPNESANRQNLLQTLCEQRGLNVESRAQVDPYVYPHAEVAVARVRAAVQNRERLTIFGDYDCDGITAAAQLLRYFRAVGHRSGRVRLPHREKDGYGLNAAVVEECVKDGTTLMITVDTGIGAVAEIAALRNAGIDVLVLDHHHAGSVLPNATAVLHPQLAPAHPLPHPSGAGVAHQLLRLLYERDVWPDCETDRALAAIGTVADLVPLTGGNRTLVQAGLAAMTDLPDGPLRTLLESADLKDKNITSTDIAFRVAPRINAAGRMADPSVALRALTEGGEYAATLATLNRDRQELTRALMEQAEEVCGKTTGPLLADAQTHYPAGVVGLIAGRLTERFGKPSAIGCLHDGVCTVSLRSPPGYHIAQGLERVGHLLLRYGGHAQAAGCTLAAERWQAFAEALSADVAAHVRPEELVPTLRIDATLDAQALNVGMVRELQQLEPYGQGNPEPLFFLPHVTLEQPRAVGSDGTHLQARVGNCKVIGFGLANLLAHTAAPLDLVCRVSVDTWQNRESVQLQVIDARK